MQQGKLNPIYGEIKREPTWAKDMDLTQPLSLLTEEFRGKLMHLRGSLKDVCEAFPRADQLKFMDGALTALISALHGTKKEFFDYELQKTKSLIFNCRGIGTEYGIGCFCCGSENAPNISGYVKSKLEGECVVDWFGQGAILDFRPSTPNYIQVKIGACKDHRPNLERLKKGVRHGMINPEIINQARQ